MVLLIFEFCFNLILVDKTYENIVLLGSKFRFQFSFGGNTKSFKWRKKKKANNGKIILFF